MILLLAGTSEARALAARLASAQIPAIASLAGATRAPARIGLPTRVGGFGGGAGFVQFLAAPVMGENGGENGGKLGGEDAAPIRAVIDATHPFAMHISNRTAEICAARGLPYLRLARPAWHATPQDRWHLIDHPEAARAQVPAGARVFLATGRNTLADFTGFADCDLTLRVIDAPGFDPIHAQFPRLTQRQGRPPFSVADELALFRSLKIDALFVKNAGGNASFSKLEAARRLQLPVFMINRPAPGPVLSNAPHVETVSQAFDWASEISRETQTPRAAS